VEGPKGGGGPSAFVTRTWKPVPSTPTWHTAVLGKEPGPASKITFVPSGERAGA